MKRKLFFTLCLFTLNFELETLNSFSQSSRLWATYYGGTGMEDQTNVTTDASGNVYLSGITLSASGIASGGFQNALSSGSADAFLVKFNAVGNRLWATYYGGPGVESGTSITTDASGNIYLAGSTESISGIAYNGFQGALGGSPDAFLVKFNPSGNLLWATYFGGSGGEQGLGVATDASENVYLAGSTQSNSSIASGGFQNSLGGGFVDAFLVKFNPSGVRLWSTYYGGEEPEVGWCVTTDKITGNVYLGGFTQSTIGIASGGFQNIKAGGFGSTDAFLAKFDGAGNRIWATYYGTATNEYGRGVATDASGNIYLAGTTNSTAGLAAGGFQNANANNNGSDDAFLVKFDAAGTRLWATYYGGTNYEEISNVVTDPVGNVYLAGESYSTSNIAAGGFQNNLVAAGTDPLKENEFVVTFDAGGNRLCASYYGQDHEEYGCVAVDRGGNVYLAGQTTSTSGIASGGFQDTFGGGTHDANLVKLTSCSNLLIATATSTDINCNSQCNGTGTAFVGGGTSPYSYNWSNDQTTQTATALCSGTYTVTITDASSLTATFTVTISSPPVLTNSITIVNISCNGDNNGSATIQANGGTTPYSYSWSNGGTGSQISNLTSQIYLVTVTDANGCVLQQTVTITEPPAITFTIISTPDTCNSNNGTASILTAGGAYFYNWSNGQTTSNISHLASSDYSLTVTDNSGCTEIQIINIGSTGSAIANAGPDITITQGNSVQLSASGGVSYTWNPSQNLSCTDCPDPIASPDQTASYIVFVTDINGCTDTDTIIVNVEKSCQEIFVPNAFSPNNDNQNDLECVLGNCIKSINFIIYDRWGEKVFATNDPTVCWNGIYKGKTMSSAVFIYSLKAILINKEEVVKKGSILLMR